MKNCNYPKCTECNLSDCQMDKKDIAALLKRRRYAADPEAHRQKQRDYRRKVKNNLPHWCRKRINNSGREKTQNECVV